MEEGTNQHNSIFRSGKELRKRLLEVSNMDETLTLMMISFLIEHNKSGFSFPAMVEYTKGIRFYGKITLVCQIYRYSNVCDRGI